MRKFKEELKTWFEDAEKFYGELAQINARYGIMKAMEQNENFKKSNRKK